MNIPIRTKILASALIGAASLLAANTTDAAFIPLPAGTPEIPGVGNPLTTILASGLYVAHLQSYFEDPGFPGVAPGYLRSLVVDTGAGYDFYYQIANLSTDTLGIDQIFRVGIGGYGDDSLFTVQVAYATSLGSITGIPGGAFTGPSIVPTNPLSTIWSADRQPNLPQLPLPANFDFDVAQGFGGFNPALSNNIFPGEISNWLVFRTDYSSYTNSPALVDGGSVGEPTALAPVPEPSTVLLGLLGFGVCAGRRFRKPSAGQKS